MSDRRRLLLMAALNNGVWLPYSYEYLYHDLIPTDINGGEVKNKARVSKVYANGVIENQLIANDKGNQSSSGIDLEYLGNGQWRVHGTADSNVSFQLSNGTYTFPVGHKFLLKVKGLESSNASNCAIRYMSAGFNTNTSIICTGVSSASAANQLVDGTDYPRIFVASGQIVDYTFTCEVIDLTQYDPFDTPTTLTDKRVQELLNRGYIPYNTGTYKGTDIGVVSSEPYNLFDGEWQLKTINQATGVETSSDRGLSSVNFISVVGGMEYVFEDGNISGYQYKYINTYDENKNFLGGWNTSTIGNMTRTMESNVAYVKIYYLKPSGQSWTIPTDSQVCFHRTGTRTGYATHQTFTPITFKYQGNGAGTSHDTYEITKTEHVFTKNMSNYTFTGNESWLDYDGGGYSLTTVISGMKSYESTELANVVWALGITIKAGSRSPSLPEYTICVNPTGRLFVMTTKNAAQLNSALAGKTVYFELATPQVIRIPRKHLGIVDLGSLTYLVDHSTHRFLTYGFTDAKGVEPYLVGNLYCSMFMTTTVNNITTQAAVGIGISSNGTISISDKGMETLDATQFKAAMSGIYLFYETENEVADINNIVAIESGGTVNTNWFGWVENQLVTNGDFATQTNWQFYNFSSANWSASDNTATLTMTSLSSGYGQFYQNIPITTGHTYLLALDIRASASQTLEWRLGNMTPYPSINATTSWQTFINVLTRTDSASDFGLYIDSNNTLPLTVYLKNVRYIDLTLAFGSGNEPTDVNDPRVQYIINQGYIPTNTIGTYKLVNCEVLPNVDFDIKCKR